MRAALTFPIRSGGCRRIRTLRLQGITERRRVTQPERLPYDFGLAGEGEAVVDSATQGTTGAPGWSCPLLGPRAQPILN
ncbi:hypothetical protein J1605_012527 [Eschrichtius robustus]|uniref:Uncharacterized protein n=1 Tax=Eschrichtius robustus TaxID=9764 RepID=A0AB34GI36_ESCRO|nr:hypothetical protein J1605_012527 [Eschrichtius robustus]